VIDVMKVAGCECRLDEAREREQRLSPVSVMDFLSQDGDDGHDDDCNDHGGGGGHSEDGDGASPAFERSLANIRSKPPLLSVWPNFQLNSVDPVHSFTSMQVALLCFVCIRFLFLFRIAHAQLYVKKMVVHGRKAERAHWLWSCWYLVAEAFLRRTLYFVVQV